MVFLLFYNVKMSHIVPSKIFKDHINHVIITHFYCLIVEFSINHNNEPGIWPVINKMSW